MGRAGQARQHCLWAWKPAPFLQGDCFMKALQWVLATPVVEMPSSSNFSLVETDLPSPSDQKVLVEIRYHTVAPGIRARIGADTYAAKIEVGEIIPGMGVGVVLDSASALFEPGDLVVGQLAWATHAIVAASDITRIGGQYLKDLPLHTALGAMGPSGLTAYFGLTDVLAIQPGETVVISSAAGSVGSAAGQIAKILGCHVIGIAGSKEKCRDLIENYGFDDALDYRSSKSLARDLNAKAPEGIDAYFDNVGGKISDAVIQNMKLFGRIAVCGQTSEYNKREPRGCRQMTSVITRRLTLRGFVVFDFQDQFDRALEHIRKWILSGAMQDSPNILTGIDLAVDGFVSQFSERSTGRLLVKIGDAG